MAQTQPTDQLALPFRFSRVETFANLVVGDNTDIADVLRSVATGERSEMIYLWGGDGCGKSHLLQAVCAEAAAATRSPAYLPLAEADTFAPALLDDLERLSPICIDDIDAVAGSDEWERALFNLYNRARDAGTALVISGRFSPQKTPFALADLGSRVAGCTAWNVKNLGDDDKCRALQTRARGLGMDMPDEVAVFLMRRSPRDMHSLFALLGELDVASLSAQRRLTVPFVKEALGL